MYDYPTTGIRNALMATPVGQQALQQYANGGSLQTGASIEDITSATIDPISGEQTKFFKKFKWPETPLPKAPTTPSSTVPSPTLRSIEQTLNLGGDDRNGETLPGLPEGHTLGSSTGISSRHETAEEGPAAPSGCDVGSAYGDLRGGEVLKRLLTSVGFAATGAGPLLQLLGSTGVTAARDEPLFTQPPTVDPATRTALPSGEKFGYGAGYLTPRMASPAGETYSDLRFVDEKPSVSTAMGTRGIEAEEGPGDFGMTDDAIESAMAGWE